MRLEQINKPIQERMPASIIKHKQELAMMTDKELANRLGDKDEKTLRQMAWRHGYGNMSSHYLDRVQNAKTDVKEYRNVVIPRDEKHYRELMKHLQDIEWDPETRRDPKLMAEIKKRRLELRAWAEKNIKREDFIGKKAPYQSFLQNKLDQAIQEFDTPEKQKARDELMKHYLAKGGTIEKVPVGQKAFVGKKLKPAFQKDKEGTPAHEDDERDWAAYKTARDEREEAPFGSGMDLVRMAVRRKFISAEEYMNYAKELKAAGEETANSPHYADWPEGEGFGSSDGNFAIKMMMGHAGYDFDEQDRSGSFIVTKMPEKLAKLGITNARMRKEPVAQESQPNEPTASQLSDEELAELIGSDPEKERFEVAVEWVRTHREEAEEIGNEVNLGHADIGEDEEINKESKLLGAAQASLSHGLELADAILKGDVNMAKVIASTIKQSWPPLIDKIQNVYKKTEDDSETANGIQPVDLKRLGSSEPKIYVHKDGKTIKIPKRKHNEFIAKGWKQSSLKAEASYESKLADMLKQRLK